MPETTFNEAADRLSKLQEQWQRIGKVLDIASKKKDLEKREAEAADPSFWTDSAKAKSRSKELNDLKKTVSDFEKLGRELDDLSAYIELAQEAEDLSELKEVQAGLIIAEKTASDMDARVKLSGEFDK